MAQGQAGLRVRVWRGDWVESEHLVSAAACDADGRLVRVWGDPARVAYLRSSLKPLQAFPLVASGAADALGLDDAEIAIACGSHSAEPYHLAAVRSLLAKAGVDEGFLQCGAHRPIHPPSADALVRAGQEPCAVHNNCSGKHAGMLALARHLGAPPEAYLDRQHPAQRVILAHVAALARLPEESIVTGVDGCGAPTFALPLAAAAGAFARLASARTGLPGGDAAARRIARAMMAHPEMVGGTGRFDTVLMQELPGRLFCKGGAEGYFAVGVPGEGIGIVLKVHDGAQRASAPTAMHLLGTLGLLPDPLPARLERFARPDERNVAGRVVGFIRVEET